MSVGEEDGDPAPPDHPKLRFRSVEGFPIVIGSIDLFGGGSFDNSESDEGVDCPKAEASISGRWLEDLSGVSRPPSTYKDERDELLDRRDGRGWKT